MDLEIRLLREKIINTINDSNIPMEAKRLVIVEILQEVNRQSEVLINAQLEKVNEDKENENGN